VEGICKRFQGYATGMNPSSEIHGINKTSNWTDKSKWYTDEQTKLTNYKVLV